MIAPVIIDAIATARLRQAQDQPKQMNLLVDAPPRPGPARPTASDIAPPDRGCQSSLFEAAA